MLELEIRQRLINYLLDRISLREFQEWFIPNTWDIHLSGEPQGAIALTNDIELRLSEFSSGHLPEVQMRREFSQLLSQATFTLGKASSVIQTSDNSAQLTWQPATPLGAGQPKSLSASMATLSAP